MEIREEGKAGTVILQPIGRLDGIESPEFEEKVLEILGGQINHLLIDLSSVEYLSSRGVRAFLAAAKKASRVGVEMALCSPQDFVTRVFEIGGFDEILNLFDSRAEAMKSFRSGDGDADSR